MSETLDRIDASDDVLDAAVPPDVATEGDAIDWWGMLTDPKFLSARAPLTPLSFDTPRDST